MRAITTQRLVLRPPKGSDLNDFYEYAKNPNVGPAAGWKPHADTRESLEILTWFIRDGNVWSIVDKLTGKMIGTVGLINDERRKNDGVKMLGYALNEHYWGQGIATEAARAVIEYGFSEERINMITVYHFTFNKRSKSVIAKCGFKFEGVLRGAFTSYDGSIYDEACYSITREEFIKQKENKFE